MGKPLQWELGRAASALCTGKWNPEEPALVSGPFCILFTELDGIVGWSLTHRASGGSVWQPASHAGLKDPVKQFFVVLKMAELVADLDWSGDEADFVPRNAEAVMEARERAIEWGIGHVN